MKELSFKKIQQAVSSQLSDRVEFCFLLGSAATSYFRDDSDIDIAVFWKDAEIPFTEKVRIKSDLEDLLGREVDLITLNGIDVIYGMQVLEKGRLLIGNNPGLLLSWKTHQLSAYPDFKTSREVIEKNILHRKKYV